MDTTEVNLYRGELLIVNLPDGTTFEIYWNKDWNRAGIQHTNKDGFKTDWSDCCG